MYDGVTIKYVFKLKNYRDTKLNIRRQRFVRVVAPVYIYMCTYTRWNVRDKTTRGLLHEKKS